MERVLGIGGLFFAASDPERLTQWYATVLGVAAPPQAYGDPSWRQQAGPTVYTAMPAGSEHFVSAERGSTDRTWAVNFRVRDLDAMVRQLREAGTEVRIDPESYPNGRFADLHDPEGNPIQLWQPDGVDRENAGE